MTRDTDAFDLDILLGRLTLALADVVLPWVAALGAESMVGAGLAHPGGGGRARMLAVAAVTLAGGVSAAWAVAAAARRDAPGPDRSRRARVAYAVNAFGLATVMAGLPILATYHGMRAFEEASAAAHGHVTSLSMAWRGALGIDAWLVVSAIGWSAWSAWKRSGRRGRAGKRGRGDGAA